MPQHGRWHEKFEYLYFGPPQSTDGAVHDVN